MMIDLLALDAFRPQPGLADGTHHEFSTISSPMDATADAISRNYSLHPFPKLSRLPKELLAVLLDTHLHWSSLSRIPLFNSCLAKV